MNASSAYPDLPGYGRSRARHGSSKRAIARALEAVTREPGFARYAVVGHDRGCYAGAPAGRRLPGRGRSTATTRPPTALPAGLVECPTLCAWSSHGDMEALYGDPPAVWRPWIRGPLHGARIDSGHHMAEEAPAELAAALTRFLRCDG